MFGLFVALGSVAAQCRQAGAVPAWPPEAGSRPDFLTVDTNVAVAVLVPADRQDVPSFVWSDDRKVGVALDGYLLTDASLSSVPQQHLRTLLERVRRLGIQPGLRSVVAGSFNLAIVDTSSGIVTIANDRLGSIPLYYARVTDGCLVSTNPVAIGRSGLIPRTLDRTACAELAYFGYPIGDRYFLEGVRVLPPASVLEWDLGARACRIVRTDMSPYTVLPSTRPPDTDAVVSAVSASCRRIARLGGKTAHFQSAGMDSRLILAAWPRDVDLPCYTYGDPDSTEAMVARSVARVRGSTFTHLWPDGDTVADNLDRMFQVNGPLIFPDRFLSAQAIRGHGFDSVTDGWLGDALIGGLHYSSDRYFSVLSRYCRLAGKFVDQKASRIGLDAIAEAMWASIVDPDADGFLRDHIDERLVAEWTAQKAAMLQDIHDGLRALMPANDSLALLFRNFKMTNRSLHYIMQQAVMCRPHLQVHLPLSNDFELLDTLLKLPPSTTAYRRFYVRLYRRHYPDYAKLLYGASLLPLRRSALAHKWSSILMSRGLAVPLLTGNAAGRTLHPNIWHRWLAGSQALRGKAVQLLSDTGVGKREGLKDQLEQVAQGRRQGSGDLFQLAGLGVLAR